MIPFIDLGAQRARIGDRIDAAVAAVLADGRYIMGPEVDELERQLAGFVGCAHALGCASGTDALVMALLALGVGPGDAVVVPTFTFAATAEAVALVGATPVFADVLVDTFNVSAASVERCLDTAASSGLVAKAVIAVDLFGQPADYDELGPLCDDRRVPLVCDAAQSFGATWQRRRVGTIGTITTTSFFPAKPLGCYGDGGAVFTDDDALADVLRSVRVHGQGEDKYENVRIGINGRLDTVQAAVLLEKLAIFPDEIVARQRVAERYSSALAPVCVVPAVDPRATSVWAQYTMRVPERDRIAASLRTQGIPTAVYYPRPLHTQLAYRSFPCDPAGLPVSEALAADVLSLPMHPYLEPELQDRIVDAVADAAADAAADVLKSAIPAGDESRS